MTPEERFWAKVDKSGECWLWTAYRDERGYGRVTQDGRCRYAHRVAYAYLVGSIPDRWHLHHTCRNPSCVNPAHLEPVSPKTHVHVEPTSNARKTHCKNGHLFDAENTYFAPGSNRRLCRKCRAAAMRAWWQANRNQPAPSVPVEVLDEADQQHVREIALSQGIVGETCRNCWNAQPWAKHLCKSCHQYLRRTGKPRPVHLIERDLRRKGRLSA